MAEDTETLFNQVLFESDRICCVCRDHSRPVQIHHIDGNHSNNDRSNLTVVCDPCHKIAHTTIPFSRNLTPDLVRLYDKSWRAICSARLLPEKSAQGVDEYRQEVLLELSLACHSWKNSYIALYPGNFRDVTGSFSDAWDMLMEAGIHPDSEEEWKRYLPLFEQSIERVIGTLQSIMTCYGDAVPVSLKTLTIRTIRQLAVERTVYKAFGPASTSVKARIQEVLRVMATLARSADAGTQVSPVVHFRE
jgi:hypothetical protein